LRDNLASRHAADGHRASPPVMTRAMEVRTSRGWLRSARRPTLHRIGIVAAYRSWMRIAALALPAL
jgi:hypothetical protein